METMLGNPTFIWKGETLPCVPNTINDAKKSSDAGFDESADFRMTVRNNVFTPNIYPQINDYITYQGYELLVKSIKIPANNVFRVYVCELPRVS